MSTQTSPKVSVIMPCYNQERYVLKALKSVSAQTYADFECIVVDDGSTDDSLRLIQDYCKTDSRFKYINKVNEGVSIARNTGIQQSCGQYLLPLDADDVLAPAYLERTVGYLESHPEVKLVYTDTELIGAKSGTYPLPDYDYHRLICRNVLVCTALFRRSDFDKTPGYNPQMVEGLEDWDFWLTFLHEDDRVHRIEESLFYYRIKAQSRNRSSYKTHYAKLREQIWQNHRDIYARHFFNPVESDEYQTLIHSREYRLAHFFSPLLNAPWLDRLYTWISSHVR